MQPKQPIHQQKSLTLLLLFCILASFGFGPNQQDSNIEVDVVAGFGSYFRANKWTPIQVTVRNNGNRDIQGSLQIRAQNPITQREQNFTTPFFVRFGSERSEYLYVSLEEQQREFIVEILDDDGRLVHSQVEQVSQIRDRDMIFGVISEADLQIQQTRRLIGSGTAYQINWRPDDIPASADALRSVDVITIYGVRNARLSETQQLAITDWVQGGGHLIVHGGAGTSWQFAQQYLSDILPTTLEGSATVDSLEALGRFTGYPSDALAPDETQGYVVTQNTPKDMATVFTTVDDIPLIVRHDVGAGVVDFVAVDPVSNPLDEYENTDALWMELMLSRSIRANWTYDFENWDAADNAVRIVTGFELPSALQMLGFLAGYIALIGPINYIILRQIKRREFAWFTIPVVIGIFTVIAYFTGFSLRGDAATVNHLAIVQSFPENDRARVDGLIGVFSPRRTTYDVGVSETMNLRTIPELENIDTGIAEIPIVEEGDYRVERLPVDAGIIASFASSGYADSVTFNGEASWIIGDNNDVNAVGYIQLALDEVMLEDAVVLAHHSFVPLGDLLPGERYEFSFDGQYEIFPDSPITFPLGNRSSVVSRPYSYINNQIRQGVPPMVNPTICGGYNITIAEVMNDKEFECDSRRGNDEIQIYRRRALLIEAITREVEITNGRGGDVYILGWSETAPFSATLEGTDQDDRFESLHIIKLPVDYINATNADEAVVPPGLMTWTLAETEGYVRDQQPYQIRLNPSDQIRFRFAPIQAFADADVAQIGLDIQVDGNNRLVEMSLWNWVTGEWELFPLGNEREFRLEEPADYLGPNNTFKVQLETPNVTNNVQISAIEPLLILQQ